MVNLIEQRYGYVGFYEGKRVEVYAKSSYDAQQEVVKLLKIKPKNSYKVHVMLAEIDGEPVVHTADF